MKHETYLHPSFDGLDLYFQRWMPDSPAKWGICLVHGMGEHSSRYTHVADYFCSKGVACIAYDLRGHGRSGGQRGHIPSTQAVIEDTHLLIQEARQALPQAPLFLYGHSLGGIIVLYYTLYQKPQLQGVIASAPGLRTAIENQKSKVMLAKALAPLFPKLSMPTGLNPQMISRDATVVQAYIHDPMVHDRATLAFATTSLAMIAYCFAHAGDFHLPLLLIHGDNDQIAFPKGSQEFAAQVHGDCTLKIWDGLYHEPHNEPEKEEVFAYLYAWMSAHT